MIGENEHYATEDIPKKQGKFEFTQKTRNPFKYDSSDDEEDNFHEGESPAEKSITKSTPKYIPLERCDSFFFIPNDPRFKGNKNPCIIIRYYHYCLIN